MAEIPFKVCASCKKKKRVADFWGRKTRKDGLDSYCKECNYAQTKDKRRRKPIVHRTGTQRSHYWRNYKLTLEDYEQMLRRQGGVCAICGQQQKSGHRLSVDHDAKKGTVRGLLCHSCNMGLGYFKDSTALMTAAVYYLERS